MLVSIIVPAYNEERTIGGVVRKLHRLAFPKEIIVVDDGSNDNTYRETMSAMKDCHDVSLLRLTRNRGKGYAIRRALRHVQGDIVAIQDADCEYDPEQLPRLIESISKNETPVVYGSRNIKANPKSYKRYYWGGRFLTFLINMLYHSKLSDEATGFKIFRTDVMRTLRLRESGFAFCPEVTCKLLRKNIPILEIPIDYAPRSMAEGKKIRWWHGMEAILVILRIRISAV